MILKETLRSAVRMQKDGLALFDRGIKRQMLNELDLTLPFALILSGIRRCGKSTLLLQAMEKTTEFCYFNFEDSKISGFEPADFQKLEEIFREEFPKADFYFLDEVQSVPKWEIFARNMLDKKKHLVITGSNASLLSRELGTKLTGRHLKYELFPFSYKEFLQFTSKKPGQESFSDYLQRGGFPEYLKYGKQEILQSLFKDAIARDIIVRHNIRSSKVITEIAIYLLTNVGKEFSYNNLKNLFGLGSANSAISYVSYLEDSYILFSVQRFDYSLKKSLIFPKKIYSIDNGLSSANSLSFSLDKGRMLENQVFLDLRRKGKEIYYFKKKHECDFLVKKTNKIIEAIQVCYELTEDNKDREVNGLLEAMEAVGLEKGTILTFKDEDEFKISGKKITAKPVWKWELENK